MSMMDQFRQDLKTKIVELSQEHGLKDDEISVILGCSRATVNRIRKANDIPTANLDNRCDKECTCYTCGQVYMIKRCERKRKYCHNCRSK